MHAGSTLTVADGSSGEDGTDTDKDNESGDHTGDVLENDAGSSTSVTGIQLGPEASPVASGTIGSAFHRKLWGFNNKCRWFLHICC